MELTGRRRLPIDRGAAWRALNDPAVLKACIPGCESIEKTGENEYSIALVAGIGPVRARFRGKLHLEDVVPPQSYTLRFAGEGGSAGFAKGSASVKLDEEDGAAVLEYAVKSQVGGRIAQVGNRLVDSSARKLAEEFFSAFEKTVSGTVSAPAPGAETVPDTVSVPDPPLRTILVAFILTALVASVAYTLR